MSDENERVRFLEELDQPLPGQAERVSAKAAEDEMALFRASFGGGKG